VRNSTPPFLPALRLRNSIPAELLLIAFVYGVGVLVIWRSHSAIDVATWYAESGEGSCNRPGPAGGSAASACRYSSSSCFAGIFRLVIWARFLWQISRIDLQLMPTHPDRAGSLGFLSIITQAFAPLLAGQGVMLAGVMANKSSTPARGWSTSRWKSSPWSRSCCFSSCATAGLRPPAGAHQARGPE
jgi:hypothetical protein